MPVCIPMVDSPSGVQNAYSEMLEHIDKTI